MNTITLLITSLLLSTLAMGEAIPTPKLHCEKDSKASLILKAGSGESKLPLETALPFKKGKLKGCKAVESQNPLKVTPVPQEKIKFFKSAYVVGVTLPQSMNGADFDMKYDVILLQDSKGSWNWGPAMLAEGLENSVTNEIVAIEQKKISVQETASAEGSDEITKKTYNHTKLGWK